MSKNRESMIKNIHIVATENSSKLSYNKDGVLVLHRLQWRKGTQHIYITADADINENDYIITKDGRLVQVSYLLSKDLEGASKVVLTTDHDLINNDVQKIDDEDFAWFVKNPSCEFVEIKIVHSFGELPNNEFLSNKIIYKAIIPKKNFYCGDEVDYDDKCLEQCENCNDCTGVDYGYLPKEFKHEFKVLTKEEVMEGRSSAYEFIDFDKQDMKTANEFYNEDLTPLQNMIEFAKWQQKGSYSEEDMIEASKYGYNFHKTTQFPTQEFEDSCIRNTKQWLTRIRKK
jgi:hypothetical protein